MTSGRDFERKAIASPGDVQVEPNIVRDVVHEWNAVNAFARGTVLLPVGWETHSSPLMGGQRMADQVRHTDPTASRPLWRFRIRPHLPHAACGTQ